MSVGYVYDELMLLHSEDGQLECPDRIVVIYNKLNNSGYIDRMIKIPSKKISFDELLYAHKKKYIENVYHIFNQDENVIKDILADEPSMFGNKYSLISAEVAAGSTLELTKHVLANIIKHGVAIVRPPGHHASKSAMSGFCFFNNIAISAMYSVRCDKRVAVVDFDIHRNDGSENIFKNIKNLLTISINRYDHGKFYPGPNKNIKTPNCININLNKKSGDKEYGEIFDNTVIPMFNEFNPDIIFVSAGFDAGRGDPLGGFDVTPQGYYMMINKLKSLNKSIICVLEGGYNLDTISNSMNECVKCLLE